MSVIVLDAHLRSWHNYRVGRRNPTLRLTDGMSTLWTVEGEVRKCVIRWMLAVLNSRRLNQSPCKYGFIGNVDAFTLDHLISEERQRPGITVAMIIKEVETFKMCALRSGVTVIEGSIIRDATVWDIHELHTSLRPPPGGIGGGTG